MHAQFLLLLLLVLLFKQLGLCQHATFCDVQFPTALEILWLFVQHLLHIVCTVPSFNRPDDSNFLSADFEAVLQVMHTIKKFYTEFEVFITFYFYTYSRVTSPMAQTWTAMVNM